MSTKGRIEDFIEKLPACRFFITRDCLRFGTRGAVDQALHLLVKTEVIVRAAYGLFYKPDSKVERPSPLETIKAKASAFGRKIAMHSLEAATKLGLSHKQPTHCLYATSGRSSSFVLREFGRRIYFHGTCERKRGLPETSAGTAILALWQLGKNKVKHEHLTRALRTFAVADRRVFSESVDKMPLWLSNMVLGWIHKPHRQMTGSILAH